MASYGYTFNSGDGVTPTRLNDARTVSAIQTADISDAQITAAKLATNAVETAKILDANVTLAKLAAAVANALTPVGAVEAFARTTAPTGWLAANGSTIGSASSGATNASADYSALFAVLWDNWSNTLLPILDSAGAASSRGASAAADFSANKRLPLPDLRGYFVRGSGTNSDATASGTFGAKQAHAFLNHSHTASSDSQGAHSHTYNEAYNAGASIANVTPYSLGLFYTTRSQSTTSNGSHSHTITVNTSTAGGTETRPANIALLYCIKF